MLNWLKRLLTRGARDIILKEIDRLDDLQPRIRALIELHGPDAADWIVDAAQEWARGVVERSLPK